MRKSGPFMGLLFIPFYPVNIAISVVKQAGTP